MEICLKKYIAFRHHIGNFSFFFKSGCWITLNSKSIFSCIRGYFLLWYFKKSIHLVNLKQDEFKQIINQNNIL